MPLRRLTRFSRLELDKREDELRAHHRGARRDPGRRAGFSAQVVSDELADVAKAYATPRRTVLLESSGLTVSAARPRSRSPTTRATSCLSSTGLLARTSTSSPPADGGGRASHDVIVSAVRDHRPRRDRRWSPPRGRVVRLTVLDLPRCRRPRPPEPPGRRPGRVRPSLEPGRARPRPHPARADGPGLALGTDQGVVKRVIPECSAMDAWEVIGLKDGDGSSARWSCATGDEDSSSSPPTPSCSTSRPARPPQGRAAGGMAGIKLAAGARRRLLRRRSTRPTRWWSPPPARRRAARAPSRARSRSPRSRSTPARAVPPAGSAATGSSRARTARLRLGRAAPARAPRQRRRRRPARAGRPPRRSAVRRHPADRRLRGARARAAVTG